MANTKTTEEQFAEVMAEAAKQYEVYAEIAQINEITAASSDELVWVHDPNASLSFQLSPSK